MPKSAKQGSAGIRAAFAESEAWIKGPAIPVDVSIGPNETPIGTGDRKLLQGSAFLQGGRRQDAKFRFTKVAGLGESIRYPAIEGLDPANPKNATYR